MNCSPNSPASARPPRRGSRRLCSISAPTSTSNRTTPARANGGARRPLSPPLRQPCPPGACVCERERLEAPGADRRILLLTRQEEQRLAARLEALRSLEDLEHLLRRMEEQLGIRLRIAPAFGEVRSMRGIRMRFEEQPGLCRKTRQAIPAAIRRGLEKRPEVAYALLNAHDLLRDA